MMKYLEVIVDLVARWFLPLVIMAILFPVLQLVSFINHWLAGSVLIVLTIVLVTRAGIKNQIWQFYLWLFGLGGAAVLACFWPEYFQVYCLFLEVFVVTIILCLPGVISWEIREIIVSIIIVEIIVSLVFFSAIAVGANVKLVVIALMAIAGGAIVSSRSGRSWEKRLAQRKVAARLFGLGYLTIAIAMAVAAWPITIRASSASGILSQPMQYVRSELSYIARPITNSYSALSAFTDKVKVNSQMAAAITKNKNQAKIKALSDQNLRAYYGGRYGVYEKNTKNLPLKF